MVIVLFSLPVIADDPSVEEIHMISGNEYTLTYDIGDSEVQNLVVDGDIEEVEKDGDTGEIDIVVEAKSVSDGSDGSVIIQTDDGDIRTDVYIFPEPDDDGEVSEEVLEDAEAYSDLEDAWINQRVDTRETSEGVLTVFEQRDPTRGSIDPETGIPEGEWVEVDVDEDGDPKWLFDDPNEAIVYTSTQANHRYDTRTMWLGGAIGIVVVSLTIQLVALPKYRQKKEEEFMYGGS